MEQRPEGRANTEKLLNKSIGGKLYDIEFSNNFPGRTPKALATKEKTHRNVKLPYVEGRRHRRKKAPTERGREYLQILFPIKG